MKKISNYYVFALALTAGVLFASCFCDDKDEAVPQPPTYSIVGEWFENESAGGALILGTSKFNADGTVNYWFGYAVAPQSIYLNYDGTYAYSDNTITSRYVSPFTGSNTTETLQVLQLDNYTLTTYLPDQATTVVYSRIVDTYDMTVGTSRTFALSDAGFVATSYSSIDASVATVDAGGSISAVKRGSTYICAESANGTAVIRVNVTDPSNVIDDFGKFMGGSINDVTAAYGSNYVEVDASPLVERTYALLDESIESVVFSYMSGTVLVANVTLRGSVDPEDVVESFSNKYTVDNIGVVTSRFHFINDGVQYDVYYFYDEGMIVYMMHVNTPDPEPGIYPDTAFEQFDNLIMMGTATAAADAFNYTLTSEDMENGWFDIVDNDNEVFTQASILFDEDPDSDEYMQIGTIMLYAKSGIKPEDIEDWYKNHYTATGDEKNPYSSSTNPVYYISFKASGSRTVVYYKFRKNR